MAMKILLVSKLHLLFRIARNKSGDGCNEMVTKFKYLGIGFSKDFFFSLIYLVLSLFQQVACSRTLLKFQKKKKKKIRFWSSPKSFPCKGTCVFMYICAHTYTTSVIYLGGRGGTTALPALEKISKGHRLRQACTTLGNM